MMSRLFVLSALWTMAAMFVQAAETHVAPRETVFFAFDDENVAWQHNLQLTLVSPDKHPANPVVRCGPAGRVSFPDSDDMRLYAIYVK